MFDEQNLAGTHIAKKDTKGRIFISRRILKPEKEKLVLMKLNDELYSLCSQSVALEEIDKINENIHKYSIEDKKELVKKELEQLKNIRSVLMDNEGRINIQNIFSETESVREIGAGNIIYLEPVVKSK